jgi:hypothetical protein
MGIDSFVPISIPGESIRIRYDQSGPITLTPTYSATSGNLLVLIPETFTLFGYNIASNLVSM